VLHYLAIVLVAYVRSFRYCFKVLSHCLLTTDKVLTHFLAIYFSHLGICNIVLIRLIWRITTFCQNFLWKYRCVRKVVSKSHWANWGNWLSKKRVWRLPVWCVLLFVTSVGVKCTILKASFSMFVKLLLLLPFNGGFSRQPGSAGSRWSIFVCYRRQSWGLVQTVFLMAECPLWHPTIVVKALKGK